VASLSSATFPIFISIMHMTTVLFFLSCVTSIFAFQVSRLQWKNTQEIYASGQPIDVEFCLSSLDYVFIKDLRLKLESEMHSYLRIPMTIRPENIIRQEQPAKDYIARYCYRISSRIPSFPFGSMHQRTWRFVVEYHRTMKRNTILGKSPSFIIE